MKKILIGLVVMISAFRVIAQSSQISISGLVTDNKKNRVESATVSLLNAKDSSVIKLVISDKAGKYSFEGIAYGEYFITISSVNFNSADYSQVKIRFDDITWIEGLRDYIKINLKSTKRPSVVRSSLKTIEPELSSNKFLRIHKFFIVSIAEITDIRKNNVFIKDMELPVGETFKEGIEKLINKKI